MIELDQLTKTFTRKDGQTVRAVDSVSLSVPEGKSACSSARRAAARRPRSR